MIKKCRICGNIDRLKFLVAKDYFLGSKDEYTYILCLACNSLSIAEIPENLSELYNNYYSFSEPQIFSDIRIKIYNYILKKSNFFSKICNLLLKKQEDLPIKSLQPIKIQNNTKILDVGCGSGSLLHLLYEMGYKNCIGIDPFLKKDIHYANGLNVKKTDFFKLDDQFDVIMFHHVFEHFPNPKEVLKHVYKLLSPNGICVIRIPNVDSYSFYRYKENWFSIHAPFHLVLPSKKGMQTLVDDTGLTLDACIGEQLIEFFFYSKGHELGVSDYEMYGNRKFIEKFGLRKIPSLHIKSEFKEAKQRLRQVKKHGLCDWIIYYLKKGS